MTRDDFISQVAALVAGLQVPVSIGGKMALGAAYEPWSRLLNEVNGGFGWTDREKCEARFAELAGIEEHT